MQKHQNLSKWILAALSVMVIAIADTAWAVESQIELSSEESSFDIPQNSERSHYSYEGTAKQPSNVIPSVHPSTAEQEALAQEFGTLVNADQNPKRKSAKVVEFLNIELNGTLVPVDEN